MIYIYIYNSSDKLQFYLFVDDMNTVYADKNLKTLESPLNAELLKVCSWLNTNKLFLNIKMTHFVNFHPNEWKLNTR